MPACRSSRQSALPCEPLLFPAAPEQWRTPESVLGPLLDEPPPPSGAPGRFDLSRAFNGPVYAMRRLHPRPRLRMDCRLGWYFDTLATCERLELEGRYRRCSIPVMRSLDGCTRTAGIGISTVVAWPDGGGWRALAAPMRARAMPDRAGLLHVVPSGMFAPPYSVTENVRRELAEELGLCLDPRRLRLTGIAVHALNQRPEICTALLLRRRPGVRWNDEFAPRPVEVPLRAGLSVQALPGFFAPGAAALALAARLLPAPGFAGE
jgi:ADP-ribose pyrophosphatase YjhB (NUDIX family)